MVVNGLSGLALGIVFGAGLQAFPPTVARDIVKGNGPAVQVGDVVTVNFEVRAKNGKELADTVKRGLPYSFVFGDTRGPAMWSDALRGMSAGGERWCVVAPDKAYGAGGLPPVVPPDASLYLHVWVVRVRRGGGLARAASVSRRPE